MCGGGFYPEISMKIGSMMLKKKKIKKRKLQKVFAKKTCRNYRFIEGGLEFLFRNILKMV